MISQNRNNRMENWEHIRYVVKGPWVPWTAHDALLFLFSLILGEFQTYGVHFP